MSGDLEEGFKALGKMWIDSVTFKLFYRLILMLDKILIQLFRGSATFASEAPVKIFLPLLSPGSTLLSFQKGLIV